MKPLLQHGKRPWLVAALLFLAAAMPAYALEIGIEVAPNVLNLQSAGSVVTVHTDIGYGAVNVYSVFLNGVAISSWKADNRGNFVAKFQMDEVKQLDGLVIDGYNTLTLIGATWSGEAFSGEDEILVLNNVPRGRE